MKDYNLTLRAFPSGFFEKANMNLNFEKFKVQVCKICFQSKLKTQHENTCPKDTMEAEMAWSMTGMSTLFGRDTVEGFKVSKRR